MALFTIIFSLLDIFIKANTMIYVKCALVKSHTVILMKYLKKHFIFDLLAILGLIGAFHYEGILLYFFKIFEYTDTVNKIKE